MDHQYSHLVIYNTNHNNILDIIKYFNTFTIAKIDTIKFIKHKNNTYGNIHLSISEWYINNISQSFYNNLLHSINITKIVYDDPKYFEIEFDNFNHEYSLCEHPDYTYNVYNLNKSNNLNNYLEDISSINDETQNDITTINNETQNDIPTINDETSNYSERPNDETSNNVKMDIQENILVANNTFTNTCSEITDSSDFNDFVKYDEFYELSSELSSQFDNLNKIMKHQFRQIKLLKKKLECSNARINYLESDIIKNNPKQIWKNRLRSRHNQP